MSAVYPLSQAGFSDFVTNLNERKRAGRKGPGRRARNNLNANNPAPPLTEMDPMPATIVSNDQEKVLPPQYQPLTNQAQAAPVVSENEKAAAPADAMPMRGGNKKRGLGPRARRQAQDLGGEGPRGRKMRMALFEDGSFPSEEEVAAMTEVHRLRRIRRQADATAAPNEQEVAAMAEVRRLRRARRQANGITVNKGNGPAKGNDDGMRARRMQRRLDRERMAAENGINTEVTDQPKRGMGPRALRRLNNAEALGPRQMTLRSGKLVDTSSDEEKTLVQPRGNGPRCGRAGRGRGGLKLARQQDEMPRGGPAKFAPAFTGDSIPNNGEVNARRFYKCGNYGPQTLGPAHNFNNVIENGSQGRRGMNNHGMRRGMHQGMRKNKINNAHFVPGPEHHHLGMAPPLRKREFNKKKRADFAQDNTNVNKNGKKGKASKTAFKPRPDIFDTPGSYIVHLPVPGATQKDIGIMWDAEKCVLRIAGMIQRPAPEQVAEGASLLRAQRPIGAFRRPVRLGKINEKVRIYENGITARLEDGILKVEVPKYDGDDMTSDGEFVEVKPAY